MASECIALNAVSAATVPAVVARTPVPSLHYMCTVHVAIVGDTSHSDWLCCHSVDCCIITSDTQDSH